MGTKTEVDRLPNCDFCVTATPAAYDAKTKQGPWANMCGMHMDRHGIGVGTGLGQRLVVRKEARS